MGGIIDLDHYATEVGEVGARGPPPIILDILFTKGENRVQLINSSYTEITQSHPDFQKFFFKTLFLYELIKALGGPFVARDT